MERGNTLGGTVIDRAGVVLVYGLEHSVSGLYNICPGEEVAAALILPCLTFSVPEVRAKFDLLAKAMDENIDAGSSAKVVK